MSIRVIVATVVTAAGMMIATCGPAVAAMSRAASPMALLLGDLPVAEQVELGV